MLSPEIIHLKPTISQEMQAAAYDAATCTGPLFESEASAIQAVNLAADVAQLFPSEVTESFAQFSKHSNLRGALVLRGLTPPEGLQTVIPDKDGHLPDTRSAKVAGLLALAATTLVGAPMSYTTNPRRHLPTLVTQVSPMLKNLRKGALRTQEATGWHAEAGGAPDVRGIEFLSLYSVRGQEGAPTMILPSHRIDNALSSRERLLLRRHAYILAGDHVLPGCEQYRRPILRDTQRGPAVSYADFYANAPATIGDTSTLRMLDKVRNVIGRIEDHATVHELQTGDVLAIDNNGLHRQGSFLPAWPHPRWQMKVFAGNHNAPLFVDPSFNV